MTNASTYTYEVDLATMLGGVTRADAGKKGVQEFLSTDPLAGEMPGWSSYNFVYNRPTSLVDPHGLAPETIYENSETGETHEVDDGFDITLKVDNGLFEEIKVADFSTTINWRSAGRNPGKRVSSYNEDYLKLLFKGASQDISSSENNNWERFSQVNRELGKGNSGSFVFFEQGLEATYSDTDVQTSRMSPTARAFARNSHAANLGTKLVLWRDDMLRPGGMSNELQHQVASYLLTNTYMTIPALGITTGNEVLNTRMDWNNGNLWRALTGQPAANGGTTAFEWHDLQNNLIGIGRAWGERFRLPDE